MTNREEKYRFMRPIGIGLNLPKKKSFPKTGLYSFDGIRVIFGPMRRHIWITTALLASLIISACQGPDNTENQQDDTSQVPSPYHKIR